MNEVYHRIDNSYNIVWHIGIYILHCTATQLSLQHSHNRAAAGASAAARYISDPSNGMLSPRTHTGRGLNANDPGLPSFTLPLDCHFAGTPSLSSLKRLLKIERGAAE